MPIEFTGARDRRSTKPHNAASDSEPDRFVGKREALRLTGLSNSSLWRRENLPADDPNRFPDRIYLSRNRVAWRLSEVVAWMERQAQLNRRVPGGGKAAQ